MTWNQFNMPGVQVMPGGEPPLRTNAHTTCDKHCTDKGHSPGCMLRATINDGSTVPNTVKIIEEQIEYAAVASDYPYHHQQRKYNPDYASKEEIKKYKHLMLLLQEALYEFCDCGAKHDKGFHYDWCTTQREKPCKKS